jgi:excinuclease ABC subunit B
VIEVRPSQNQIDDLLEEIDRTVKTGSRVLVTTLTKRMAEELTKYLGRLGIKCRYIHAEVETLERVEIMRDLRLGKFDVLVGINLLREGLDLPEVSLVAILDADKEGFLRSARSLIQTFGRAARNVQGTVIMYADGLTPAMRQAMEETARRRQIQAAHNHRFHIVPTTIRKEISRIFDMDNHQPLVPEIDKESESINPYGKAENLDVLIERLEAEMQQAAKELEFEKAADLRDHIKQIKKTMVFEI